MDFIFDPSLVLYLPLYELDGASFMSKDNYGHLCTVTGALWTPRGRSFDGSDDKIVITDCPALRLTTEFTFVLWLNPNVSNTGRFAGKAKYTTAWQGWNLVLNANEPRAYWGNGTTEDNLFSGYTCPQSVWSCVGLSYNSVSGLVYFAIDGEQKASKTTTKTVADSGTNFEMGTCAAGGFFGGCYGDLILYNRALTPLEIQHNYLATKWRYK